MAKEMIKLLIIFIISFSSNFSPALSKRSSSSATNITWWCSKTPHPEPCKYFLTERHQLYTFNHLSQFRNILVQVATEQALNAEKQVLEYGAKCETKHQKAVWSDCLKLYANTVVQLNNILQGLGSNNNWSCTDFDAQTWLSAALTNIGTCESGFKDLKVYNFIAPVMSNNLSQLISNSLAVNGVSLKKSGKVSYTNGFPNWLSSHERNLLDSSSSSLMTSANLVVARDGSGHYTTIQAAVNAAATRRGSGRFVIFVKQGVYRENVEVGFNNDNIMLVGQGMKNTVIVASASVGGGSTTYSSATVGIDGLQFIARDITFVNTAGPQNAQAVALRSASDLSVFYRCAFQGYQDTLMVQSQRQFYKQCYIYGTIDFIFGNAAVVFQNCIILVRRPLNGQANVITAQGRNDPFQNTAISIHNSQILPAPDLKPVVRSFATYMGRPWMQYSRTVILKTYIDGFVSPRGWSTWTPGNNFALDTLFYGEYRNFGPGASTSRRVRWRGFHVITSPSAASQFTAGSLIAGGSWLPATGVPFILGL